ncbi:cyclic GMP-AMP synthase isoform X1 [Camelus ferus]|uniref:Cyclic GMP-AMP synthase n=1 Tax=Camelus ferus TaxID=419612 RepID=A0A8B8RE70_CAMFR|nr:cyclic GMP-AMP synthase isoform X1 [Camelus ferus]
MAPPREKATRTASVAGAVVPMVSARSAQGVPIESSGPPEATRAPARRSGRPGEKPRGRAPPSRAEDQAEGAAAPTREGEPPAAPGPPLPSSGSHRQGSVRATRERRPQPSPVEVPGPTESRGPLVPNPGRGLREAAPGAWKLRAVLEQLRLSRREISAAVEVVNRVVDHLLRKLQQGCESEFRGVGLLRTGSYYERVKVSAPNEFDVMFKLEVPRIELQEYANSGTHYFVKFKRNPKGDPLNQFLEGEILSASKMLSKFRAVIKEEIKNIEADTDVIVERKKKGSPAVTLLMRKPMEISVDITLALESKGSWPASTLNGLPINRWLGVKVRNDMRRRPFYLVPKHAREGSGFQEETWRLSFSHVEKDLLKNHGQAKTCCETDGVKCCRKDCLKLMKYLLEQLKKKFGKRKELTKFCSYHVKTAFFHVCTQDPCDSQWLSGDLELCFDKCVTYFLQCLRTEQLQHYFIPTVNLFAPDQIDKASKEFLSKQIEDQRNNGFPVFGAF